MYVCVLDFEASCWEDNNLKEVIEVPSVLYRWNKDTKEYLFQSEFQQFCKPLHKPVLSEFCKKLTGITQNQVDNGITFKEALNKHYVWLCNNSDINNTIIVTCGAWDLEKQAPIEYKKYKMTDIPSVYLQFINIKDEYSYFYDCYPRGMPSMLKDCKLKLIGHHHSGIDDCRNISRILDFMIKDGYTITNKSIIKVKL
jgi:inhibitor of KinA sporulation pathway (predicted exonuclease)